VLPGVGHFGHCARELARFRLDRTMAEVHARGIPLLGLCVGMQLLFETSEEDAGTHGLGLLRGMVRRLTGAVRVPHTGWDEVRIARPHAWLAGVPERAHFYFVHSYAPAPADERDVVGTTDYGDGLTAIVARGSLLGVQFHPEKSGAMGTRLLRGFVSAQGRVAA
jgi:glutamine amidotransferase